jgi:hypothetical protein
MEMNHTLSLEMGNEACQQIKGPSRNSNELRPKSFTNLWMRVEPKDES